MSRITTYKTPATMRINRVELYQGSELTKKGKRKTKYIVAVQQFYTFRWWLWCNAYHWYDMHFPGKVPGWFKFEAWLHTHGAQHLHFEGLDYPKGGKRRIRDRLYGWTIAQDLRCPINTGHKIKQVYRGEVDEETYRSLQTKHDRVYAQFIPSGRLKRRGSGSKPNKEKKK